MVGPGQKKGQVGGPGIDLKQFVALVQVEGLGLEDIDHAVRIEHSEMGEDQQAQPQGKQQQRQQGSEPLLPQRSVIFSLVLHQEATIDCRSNLQERFRQAREYGQQRLLHTIKQGRLSIFAAGPEPGISSSCR